MSVTVKFFATIFYLCLLYVCPVSAIDAPINQEITPIVQVLSGEITTCGVRVRDTGNSLSVSVKLVKQRKGAALFIVADGPDTRRVIEQEWYVVHNPVGVIDIVIPGFENAQFSPSMAGGDQVHGGGYDEAGFIVQRFMLAGGEFTLDAAGKSAVMLVKGPLPQNVRATYLNCTGDMYRQE